jgi:lipopolysaccharide transport system permease protein
MPSGSAVTSIFARDGSRPVKVIRPVSSSFWRLLSQVRHVRDYTDLIYTLSEHRVRVRYKQSLLGLAWAILQPLSLMLIYTIVFSSIAKIETHGVPYAIFVFVGLLPWSYFSTALTTGTNSLTGQISLITKVYFPREILPLTYVIAALFDFLVASLLLVGMLLWYRVPISMNILYAFAVMSVMTIFVLSMVLIFAATQVHFRDVGMGIPLLLQIWMFATPIVYPLDAVSGLPDALRHLYMVNPMVGLIDGFRRAVLHGAAPDFSSFRVSVIVCGLLLPVAYLYFKRVEATAADVI